MLFTWITGGMIMADLRQTVSSTFHQQLKSRDSRGEIQASALGGQAVVNRRPCRLPGSLREVCQRVTTRWPHAEASLAEYDVSCVENVQRSSSPTSHEKVRICSCYYCYYKEKRRRKGVEVEIKLALAEPTLAKHSSHSRNRKAAQTITTFCQRQSPQKPKYPDESNPRSRK